MNHPANPIPVYLEAGKRRTFAGAIDWPGWCRSGRDETAAMQALLACAPRYARVLQPAGLPFAPPGDIAQLPVVETLPGNATTGYWRHPSGGAAARTAQRHRPQR